MEDSPFRYYFYSKVLQRECLRLSTIKFLGLLEFRNRFNPQSSLIIAQSQLRKDLRCGNYLIQELEIETHIAKLVEDRRVGWWRKVYDFTERGIDLMEEASRDSEKFPVCIDFEKLGGLQCSILLSLLCFRIRDGKDIYTLDLLSKQLEWDKPQVIYCRYRLERRGLITSKPYFLHGKPARKYEVVKRILDQYEEVLGRRSIVD